MGATEKAAGPQVRLLWPDGGADTARLRVLGKSGGAGEVFNIDDRPDLVAKIYHEALGPAQLAKYERKLHWMVNNRPALPAIPSQYRGIVQLAWPVGMVMRGARFAGFAMEKVDFERTLELDYLLNRRQAAGEGFTVDFGKLVTVGYNLATLIDCLHGRRIAVVDLKPINLKVYKSELYVSILDCDGFHIDAADFVAEAPQVTPEYLAPEFHGGAVRLPQSQDAFALATIVFRLLNYGIHPYAGIATGRQPYPTELAGRIRQGLYPYGKQPALQVRPAPASVHECMPDALRELFDRSFVPMNGSRVSAGEWAATLERYADRHSDGMTRCAAGHLKFTGMDCASCRREGILQGHAERHRQFAARVRATPVRALKYVRRTLRGTHTSPFQAALAQAQLNPIQIAPVTLPLRNVLAIEMLWALGLFVTYWWLR